MPALPEIFVSPPHKSGYLRGLVRDLSSLNGLNLAKFSVDNGLARRHQRSLSFNVNGKLIFLDGNNRPEPSTWIIKEGNREGYDLIIKLQYRPSKFWDKCPVPITSWTFTEFQHGKAARRLDQYRNTEHKYRCGFVGRWYYSRVGNLKKLANLKGTDAEYWHKQRNKSAAYPVDQYLDRVCGWQSALILAGRSRTTGDGIDGKSWREIECAAMGVPMIMETDRHYFIPFRPGVHYIQIQNEDIGGAIEQAITDKELGVRARQWFDEAASPVGVCRTFMQLLEQYGIL